MSMINEKISEFCIYAYHENKYKFVNKEDILGKWSVFFFYPADFNFGCLTELEGLADKYEQFKERLCCLNLLQKPTRAIKNRHKTPTASYSKQR